MNPGRERMPIDTQALFDEKDYTGIYPYVADGVIGPYLSLIHI